MGDADVDPTTDGATVAYLRNSPGAATVTSTPHDDGPDEAEAVLDQLAAASDGLIEREKRTRAEIKARDDLIVRSWLTGYSTSTIAAATDLTTKRVRDILGARGLRSSARSVKISARGQKILTELRKIRAEDERLGVHNPTPRTRRNELIGEAFLEKVVIREIAAAIGLSGPRIKEILDDQGITAASRNRRRTKER